MHHDAQHRVILAEMARAVRTGQPDADWHEVEPHLRALWEHAPRAATWSEVRSEAARHWRFGEALPPCTVVSLPDAARHTACVGLEHRR